MTTSPDTESPTTDDPIPTTGESKKHPRGLLTLAATALWERLSFYGLQVILAYYIYYSLADGGLGLDTAQALAITGAYGGVVYLMEPVGAWVADRVVAARIVVVFACAVIISGHLILALAHGLTGLLAGLACIAVGTGGLGPNLRSMVGDLYESREQQRDAGFSLFYTGILIGALVGPIITGMLQVELGFHIAFSAAAFGMILGLTVFVARWRTLPAAAARVPNPLDARGRITALAAGVGVLAILGVLFATSIITFENIHPTALVCVVVAAIAYFVVLRRSRSTTDAEKRKVTGFIVVYLASVLFWTLVLQLFTTFAVFADTRVDWNVGAWSIPAAYISTFEVVAGIIAGPLIALAWQKLGPRQPNGGTKLALGLALMALTFAAFAGLALLSGEQVSFVPVIIGMVMFGIAEVTFAPVSFSATAQMAPRAFKAQMMALQGLSLAAGATLSGFVGQLYHGSNDAVFFGGVALVTIVAAGGLFACRNWLQRRGLN